MCIFSFWIRCKWTLLYFINQILITQKPQQQPTYTFISIIYLFCFLFCFIRITSFFLPKCYVRWSHCADISVFIHAFARKYTHNKKQTKHSPHCIYTALCRASDCHDNMGLLRADPFFKKRSVVEMRLFYLHPSCWAKVMQHTHSTVLHRTGNQEIMGQQIARMGLLFCLRLRHGNPKLIFVKSWSWEGRAILFGIKTFQFILNMFLMQIVIYTFMALMIVCWECNY